MKAIVTIILIFCLLLLPSCKKGKREKESTNNEEVTKEKVSNTQDEKDTSLEGSLLELEEALKDLSETEGLDGVFANMGEKMKNKNEMLQQKIREALGNSENSFLEEKILGNKARSAKVHELKTELEGATIEETKVLLAQHFKVDNQQLDALSNLPPVENITSEKQALTLMNYKKSETLLTLQKSSPAYSSFNNLLQNNDNLRKMRGSSFANNAKSARNNFYKKNPGWYGEGETIGNTYMDSRKKYIYLPFGARSFADKVISHELGDPKGSNANGALGEPDMPHLNTFDAHPMICNIGIKGTLTLEFTDNALANVNGPDLYVFEMGALEPTILEISKDGINWIEVGKIRGGTAQVDIEPYVEPGDTFNFVRLTDLDSPSTLPGADVDAVAAIGGAIRLNIDSSVLFDSSKYDLKEGAELELDKLLEQVLKLGKGAISVEGHTDSDGDTQSNLTLSENRAQTVANFLKLKLKKGYTFSTKGYGESRPTAPNDTEENKQKNRRVEILVVPH